MNGIDPLGLILFDDSSSFALALLGRTLDPRALFENIASGDSFRVASAYSYHALMAPYHMAQAVYHSPAAIAALWDLDLEELKCLLKDKYHEFLYAPPEQQMEMLAALTGDAAGAWATGAGAANALKALRAAQAAKSANLADNVADAARLRTQLASQEIAGGHAFGKHVVKEGQFPGITTPQQFGSHIENVMNNPSAVRHLSNGRTAYWDSASGTVVIRNPTAIDGGTAFKPTQGKTYFDNLK